MRTLVNVVLVAFVVFGSVVPAEAQTLPPWADERQCYANRPLSYSVSLPFSDLNSFTVSALFVDTSGVIRISRSGATYLLTYTAELVRGVHIAAGQVTVPGSTQTLTVRCNSNGTFFLTVDAGSEAFITRR